MKTDAVNALFAAAMNSGRDGIMWIRVARMSRDLGFWTQAIKAYDKYPPPLSCRGNDMVERIDLSRTNWMFCMRGVFFTLNMAV